MESSRCSYHSNNNIRLIVELILFYSSGPPSAVLWYFRSFCCCCCCCYFFSIPFFLWTLVQVGRDRHPCTNVVLAGAGLYTVFPGIRIRSHQCCTRWRHPGLYIVVVFVLIILFFDSFLLVDDVSSSSRPPSLHQCCPRRRRSLYCISWDPYVVVVVGIILMTWLLM